MMLHTFLTFIITLLLISQVAQAEIYKWTDENGVLHYSSTPRVLAPNVEKIKLQEIPADKENAFRKEQLLYQKAREIRRAEQNDIRQEKRVWAEQRSMLKQEARDKDMCEKYLLRYKQYKTEGVKSINLITGKVKEIRGAAARNAIQEAKDNVELFCQ